MREIKFRVYDKIAEKMRRWETVLCMNIGNVLRGICGMEVMQYTGLHDRNGVEIYDGDITELKLDSGEVRHFKVSFKRVIRKVMCHPDFYDDVAKVELNAVIFEWQGYELFPCIDENGVSDVSRMEVIGNIYLVLCQDLEQIKMGDFSY